MILSDQSWFDTTGNRFSLGNLEGVELGENASNSWRPKIRKNVRAQSKGRRIGRNLKGVIGPKDQKGRNGALAAMGVGRSSPQHVVPYRVRPAVSTTPVVLRCPLGSIGAPVGRKRKRGISWSLLYNLAEPHAAEYRLAEPKWSLTYNLAEPTWRRCRGS